MACWNEENTISEGLACHTCQLVCGKIKKNKSRDLFQSHLRKLPALCPAHKDLNLSQLFSAVLVKVDIVQEKHIYCTGTWHAEGSSLKHGHRGEGRRRVKPVELAAHLQYKLCIQWGAERCKLCDDRPKNPAPYARVFSDDMAVYWCTLITGPG